MQTSDVAPLGQQILVVLFGPPVMAALIWVLSRGWAAGIQAGNISDATKQRQKLLFWYLLFFFYVILIAMYSYAWITRR